MELPRIQNEDDWLDLKEGEQAIISGNVRRAKSGNVLIGMTDWSDIAIESDIQGPVGNITLVVERTEDGLKEVRTHTENA